jgi:hypothetical protein
VDSSRTRAGSGGWRAHRRTPTRSTAPTSPTTSSATVPRDAALRHRAAAGESVEEFSAATTNANATFGRGSARSSWW